MAEIDGYARVLDQIDLFAFEPPLSPSSAAAGLASIAFFPLAFGGNQAAGWVTQSSATAQGGGFTAACIPGRQYTSSIYAWQATSATQQITIDGTTAGTSLAIPLVWTRLSVTFTATQPSHSITVQTTGTAIPGAVFADNVQHEPGAVVTVFNPSGTTAIYGVFRGYMERWPSMWDHKGFRGRSDAVAIDALGALNKTTLWTEYRNSVLAKSPTYYWPLSEPSGAISFAEASGNNGSLMVIRTGSGGAGAATVTAGATTSIPGDASGTGVTVAGGFPATNVGLFLYGPTTPATTIGSNAATWSMTMAVWVIRNLVGDSSTAFEWVGDATTIAAVDISCFANGGFIFEAGNFFNGFSTAQTAKTYADSKPHLFVGTMSIAGGNCTLTLYVDGVQQQTTTDSCTTNFGSAAPDFRMYFPTVGGSTRPTGLNFIGLMGTYAHPAVWNRALSAAEISDLWQAGGKGYSGETSGARISRYLSYGYVGATSVATGLSTMGVSTLTANTSTLSACQDVTVTENGEFWAPGTGAPTFKGRDDRYLRTTSTYTFGENAAGGEFPYQDAIGFDLDPTFIYNDVTITQASGAIAHTIDATSKFRFFPEPYAATVNCLTANEAIDHATYILGQHKQPRQRVASITLDPAGSPTLWPVVLGLEISTRVTVKRRATAGGLVMSGDYFVESIAHEMNMAAGT